MRKARGAGRAGLTVFPVGLLVPLVAPVLQHGDAVRPVGDARPARAAELPQPEVRGGAPDGQEGEDGEDGDSEDGERRQHGIGGRGAARQRDEQPHGLQQVKRRSVGRTGRNGGGSGGGGVYVRACVRAGAGPGVVW